MNATAFAKSQRLCAEVRTAKMMVSMFHRLALKAMDDHRYEDAAVCFENAANWARKCVGGER